MHGLAEVRGERPARVEAPLELEERVLEAADAAAEVEAREPVRRGPGGRLHEEEVVRAELLAALRRGAEVVVEERRRREAEDARDDLAVDAGVSADEHVAERSGELRPVRSGKK